MTLTAERLLTGGPAPPEHPGRQLADPMTRYC